MKQRTKLVVIMLLAWGLLLGVARVRAECSPADCNPELSCNPGEHCVASCCVTNGGGASCNSDSDCPGECCNGGSCGACNGGNITCPPGTVLTGSYPSCTIAGNPPCCTVTNPKMRNKS